MADGTEQIARIEVGDTVAALDPAEWDLCAEEPFTAHRFLAALEASGSVGPGTGWTPQPLVARGGDGALLGVAPLYLKTHSQGEYVFDHAWADAWERAGGRYYPKLQIAAPFTPVSGRRFLTAPGVERPAVMRALMAGAAELCARNNLSSLHVSFCARDEWEIGVELGFLQRRDQQFHWLNDSYRDFADFLDRLSSRKRKQIRKERETACSSGVEIVQLTGDELRTEHWDAIWAFYQDTGARKWGRPYLTRAFFEAAHREMAQDALLVMARRDGRWVAGALNFFAADAIYGRYWGCVEDIPCLHFEICYYQAIEIAIARGLARVEAGAQGAHKLARGYLPHPTYSLHFMPHGGFRNAVEDYLARERVAVAQDMEFLREMGPFKKEG